MKKISALLSICSLIALFSCTSPSGVDITKHFDANFNYYRLEVSDGMNVTVSDAAKDIVITGDENIMEKLVVKHSGSTLQIYRKDVSLMYLSTCTVTLPYNSHLTDVRVRSNSEFHTDYGLEGDEVDVLAENHSRFYGYLRADIIELKVKDHSDVSIDFDAESLAYVEIKESSNARLEGYAHKVNLEMNDNSVLEKRWNGSLYAFMCDFCQGHMNDNCKAYIDCEESISMTLTNNSYLYYTSDPYIGDSSVDPSSGMTYDGY